MAEFHDIIGGTGETKLKAIFVHGLGGHFEKTWTCSGDSDQFWPTWLLDDAPGVRVSSVEYDASPSKWLSSSMSIADRAANIASHLGADENNANVPLAFLGHSLGGNVIKAVIRHMHDHQAANPRFAKILQNIKLVIFIGTPHSGSRARRIIPGFLRKLARVTPVTDDLEADSSSLRDLANWYRTNLPQAAKHVALVETRLLKGLVEVVSPSSSDPGLPNVVPVPIDADHVSICKPEDRSSEVYKIILDSIKTALSDSLPAILQDPDNLGGKPVDRTLRRRRGLNSRLDSHRENLIKGAEDRPFTILLCGAFDAAEEQSAAGELSRRLSEMLQEDGFAIVHGQTMGITDTRLGPADNTLGRELDFIGSHCNAVIIIASGPIGWSEAGLFSWHMASDKSTRDKGVDIVVLANQHELGDGVYIRQGPIAYSDAVGRAEIVDFAEYDPNTVLHRMRARRSMYVMDRRGRPKKNAA